MRNSEEMTYTELALNNEFLHVLKDIQREEDFRVKSFERTPRELLKDAKEIFKRAVESTEPDTEIERVGNELSQGVPDEEKMALLAIIYLMCLLENPKEVEAKLILYELRFFIPPSYIAYMIMRAVKIRGGEIVSKHRNELEYLERKVKDINLFIEELNTEIKLFESFNSPLQYLENLSNHNNALYNSEDKKIEIFPQNSNNESNKESQQEMCLVESVSDVFKNAVAKYGFFELPNVKQLNDTQQSKLIDGIVSAAEYKYKIAALYQLGFVDKLKQCSEFKNASQWLTQLGEIVGVSLRRVQDSVIARGPKESLDDYISTFDNDYSSLTGKSIPLQKDENQSVRKNAQNSA